MDGATIGQETKRCCSDCVVPYPGLKLNGFVRLIERPCYNYRCLKRNR